MKRPDNFDVLPWTIAAGNDGLRKDCILVGTLEDEELVSVRLYVVEKPAEGE